MIQLLGRLFAELIFWVIPQGMGFWIIFMGLTFIAFVVGVSIRKQGQLHELCKALDAKAKSASAEKLFALRDKEEREKTLNGNIDQMGKRAAKLTQMLYAKEKEINTMETVINIKNDEIQALTQQNQILRQMLAKYMSPSDTDKVVGEKKADVGAPLSKKLGDTPEVERGKSGSLSELCTAIGEAQIRSSE